MSILEKGSSDETRIWMGSSEIKGTLTNKIGRVATITVAASDASPQMKRQADFVCLGTYDNIVLQQALDALPATGGELMLSEGNYHLGATLTRAIDNVTIKGMGYSTYLAYNGSSFIISCGVQARWVVSNLRVDYGGIEFARGTKWVYDHVWRGNGGTVEPFLIDQWSEEHIAPQSQGNFVSTTYRHPLMKVIEEFETIGDWTATTATLSAETTIKNSGTQSIKMITTGTVGKMDKTISVTDFTNCAFGFWMYTPDPTKISMFKLYLRTTTTNWVNYIYNGHTYIYTVTDHWHFIVIPYMSQSAGSPDLSNVNLMRIEVTPVAGQVATVYFDKLYCWKRTLTPKGAVSFTFDDGMPSIPEVAKPLFDRNDYKGVFSVVISRMDDTLKTTAKMMQNDGWDIVSHSYDHVAQRSLDDPDFQYLLAQKWLADNGFKFGSGCALLNNGVQNTKMIKGFNDNFTMVRSSEPGYNALPGIGTTLYTQVAKMNVTAATVKTWIDIAKLYGVWLIIMLHDIKDVETTEYDFSTSKLTEVLDYCVSTGVEVVTFSQMVDRIETSACDLTNSGTGTIASGQTSVNIRHGFHKVPKQILLTLTSSLGTAASIWVSSKDVGSTGNLFTVSINAGAGADVTFDWRAVL